MHSLDEVVPLGTGDSAALDKRSVEHSLELSMELSMEQSMEHSMEHSMEPVVVRIEVVFFEHSIELVYRARIYTEQSPVLLECLLEVRLRYEAFECEHHIRAVRHCRNILSLGHNNENSTIVMTEIQQHGCHIRAVRHCPI